ARVAVRLKEHKQPIEFATVRGFKSGANFGGMMAVVVNNSNVGDDAFDVEASPNTRKFCEPLANQIGRHVQIKRDGGRGRGVAHVMNAGRMNQVEDAKVIAFVSKTEFAAEAFHDD